MTSIDDEITDYVRENGELIAKVIRSGEDPYARACALVLLMNGGEKRDIEAVKEEVERL